MRKDFLNLQIWSRYKSIDTKIIKYIESQIRKKFPKSYQIIIEKFNGGTPKIDSFNIPGTDMGSGIGGFLSLSGVGIFYSWLSDKESEFLHYFNNPAEFFPKEIIAFAKDGGGNCICFDYRNDSDTDNPPIVYWDHEAPEDESVYFLANNFDEFLDMLYEG